MKLSVNLNDLKIIKLSFFSSYRHNFLASHFMYIFTQFKDGVMTKLLLGMLFYLMTNLFKDQNHILKKDVLNQHVKKLTSILNYVSFVPTNILSEEQKTTISNINKSLKIIFPSLIEQNFVDEEGHKVNEINLDKNVAFKWEKEKIVNTASNLLTGFAPINTTIQGVNNNEYGIGLGQFFICIAIWIGCLMQTFIYDREKRCKKANHAQHYFSKWLLMWSTALIQTTLLFLSLLTLNFQKIGASFGLLYIWMLFTVTIFITVQQAIWFAFKDGDIGKFIIIIIYMIINLSSGWGTLPAFMQAKFFNVLAYIALFTYVLHAMGDIVYGIANPIGIDISVYQSDILINLAILLIWPLIFITLGFFTIFLHAKKDRFGTISNKKIYQVLSANDNLNNFIIEHNNNKKIDFKAIDEQTALTIKQSYLDNFAKKMKIKSKKTAIKD